MATKYSAQWSKGGNTEGIALFSDAVPREVMVDFIDSLWANCADDISYCNVIDMDTGEVIHDRDSWDEPDAEDWPDMSQYNEDCGFDPYMGCYTDDC